MYKMTETVTEHVSVLKRTEKHITDVIRLSNIFSQISKIEKAENINNIARIIRNFMHLINREKYYKAGIWAFCCCCLFVLKKNNLFYDLSFKIFKN